MERQTILDKKFEIKSMEELYLEDEVEKQKLNSYEEHDNIDNLVNSLSPNDGDNENYNYHNNINPYKEEGYDDNDQVNIDDDHQNRYEPYSNQGGHRGEYQGSHKVGQKGGHQGGQGHQVHIGRGQHEHHQDINNVFEDDEGIDTNNKEENLELIDSISDSLPVFIFFIILYYIIFIFIFIFII